MTIKNYKNYPPTAKQKIRKQLVNFYNKNFLLSQWSVEYFNNFLDDKQEKKMLCLILEENRKILGFVLGRLTGNISLRYNLTTLLVDRRYRGRGLSKILMDEFLEIIKKNKSIEKVYLHFRDSNNFESFYKHYGFGKHRITGRYSNGEKKHYMEININ